MEHNELLPVSGAGGAFERASGSDGGVYGEAGDLWARYFCAGRD